jgi:hypothetical protein
MGQSQCDTITYRWHGNGSKRLKVVMSRDEDLLPETVVGLTSLHIVAPYTILVVADTFLKSDEMEMWYEEAREHLHTSRLRPFLSRAFRSCNL